MTECYKEYGWGPDESHMHAKFMPHILAIANEAAPGGRVLDVGCGNGSTCGELLRRGFKVTGVDLSQEGIEIARKAYPEGRFEVLPADSNMLEKLGGEPFDILISTEVVEHLYFPRAWANGCFSALRPGGLLICTTPYHGYLKNLALSVAGKWDSHASPLWDGGHIKIWSKATLSQLLTEAGFEQLQFRGVGRVPFLWMTMVMSGKKPIQAA
jgi:2-polyprenyl-3-methyl-5-hydroxy-6-metoxy-1,4-benzoquinol methylase